MPGTILGSGDIFRSKTVKNICCPRANILVGKLDNGQIERLCVRW
jgi:hypothetical protein